MTTYTVRKGGSSFEHSYGRGRDAAVHPESFIQILDADGKVVAYYKRKSQGWGAAVAGARYTLVEDDKRDSKWKAGMMVMLYPKTGQYTVGDCAGHIVPGEYRNLREAWKAQVEQLYGVQVGR
jgi:hypothetical protein